MLSSDEGLITPIACCSLGEDALAERRERWRRLAQRSLLHAGATERGARQRYRADTATRRELEALVALERDCCPALRFTLSREADALVLEVTGPPHAEPALALFRAG